MNRQNVTLNLWKFIAALLIVGHHASSIGAKGDYIFHGAYIYTEFFFIVSGFFLVRELENGKVKGCMDYSKKIWMKLFPYTTVVISVYYFVSGILSSSIVECFKLWIKWPLEIFYLNELHIARPLAGQLWYVAAMLFIMPLLCWLFKRDKNLFQIIIYVAPLIWYGYCYTVYGQLGHRGVFIDLIRAFTNLSLGGCCFYISRKISEYGCGKKFMLFGTIISWGGVYITCATYI